jgi:predicted alpha/beta-hydrolase family hydrolase
MGTKVAKPHSSICYAVREMLEELASHFTVGNAGEVSSLLILPRDARWLLVLGHGAGAGMRHPFMGALSRELAAEKIATFRYQFPYMENGRKAPDRPPTLTATVAAATQAAHVAVPHLPLLAGGKSMGGRMTSTAASENLIPEVRGLVFFGFPLHPPKQPATKRGDHLAKVTQPMLFLQGTRDDLAELKLLTPICRELGELATLHIIEGADHSFHMLKSSGKSDGEVLRELAHTTAEWAAALK